MPPAQMHAGLLSTAGKVASTRIPHVKVSLDKIVRCINVCGKGQKKEKYIIEESVYYLEAKALGLGDRQCLSGASFNASS